jgi:hypothetical protein
MKWAWWVAPVLAATAVVWCAVSGYRFWFTPVRYLVVGGVPGRPLQRAFEYRPFAEVSGYGALPLIVPVFIAIIATYAAFRGLRLVLALSMILFVVFTFITGFSIGGAYLPCAGLLALSTVFAFAVSPKPEGRSVDAQLHAAPDADPPVAAS